MLLSEITVEELAQWRREGRHCVVLDVREPFELQMAKLEPALHIPMREIPARLYEIERDAPVAVLCHHGGRSAHVTQYLQANGFARAVNVVGGIDAWAKRVDASVGVY